MGPCCTHLPRQSPLWLRPLRNKRGCFETVAGAQCLLLASPTGHQTRRQQAQDGREREERAREEGHSAPLPPQKPRERASAPDAGRDAPSDGRHACLASSGGLPSCRLSASTRLPRLPWLPAGGRASGRLSAGRLSSASWVPRGLPRPPSAPGGRPCPCWCLCSCCGHWRPTCCRVLWSTSGTAWLLWSASSAAGRTGPVGSARPGPGPLPICTCQCKQGPASRPLPAARTCPWPQGSLCQTRGLLPGGATGPLRAAAAAASWPGLLQDCPGCSPPTGGFWVLRTGPRSLPGISSSRRTAFRPLWPSPSRPLRKIATTCGRRQGVPPSSALCALLIRCCDGVRFRPFRVVVANIVLQ
mmetsp:Transcript_1155/g.2466  ORF Transcript_1155/g.2466 Transcript_1155/m.2466 type:complete len:357 (-) Transcript_1155:8-1078(-)